MFSTGFGHDLAKRLDALGFRVFAGCLEENGPGARELEKSCSDRLQVLQLNVTKEEQIDAVRRNIETVHQKTGCGNHVFLYHVLDVHVFWKTIQDTDILHDILALTFFLNL